MGCIRLYNSMFKSFMPEGDGGLFFCILCQLLSPVAEEWLELKAVTQGDSLPSCRTEALRVRFQDQQKWRHLRTC